MSQDQEVLLVHRCEDMTAQPLAVGTIACKDCGANCWIAKTSIALIARIPHIVVLCTRCLADSDVEVTEVRAVPGSLQEVSDLLAQDNYTGVREAPASKRKS